MAPMASISDLRVQIADCFFGKLGRRNSLAAALEDACGTLKQRSFPLMNHRRMHAIFGRQLRHRALPLHGLQRHSRFERRIVVPAFRHVLISSRLETSRLQIIASVTVRFSGRSSTLVQKIKSGMTIRSAQLEILADLFQFGYEGAFGGGPVMRNYGLLWETGKQRTEGKTNARLEEMLIEWAPKLRVSSDGGTSDVEPTDLAMKAVAEDVRQIRARLESLYQASIFAVVILVVFIVIKWSGL
jgi:hypothetical protein